MTYYSCNKSMPAARPLQKSAAMFYNTRPIWSCTCCLRPIHLAQPYAFFFSYQRTHSWHPLWVSRKNRLKFSLSQTRKFVPTQKLHSFYLYTDKYKHIYTGRYLHIWGLIWVLKWDFISTSLYKWNFICLWILWGNQQVDAIKSEIRL